MKNMKNLSTLCPILLALSLVLTGTIFANPAFAAGNSLAENKDETVYGFLNTDGSIKDVRVVNRLITSDGGKWIDSGNYLSVRAMEAVPEPDLSPGRVVWDLTGKKGKSFYYEGVMNKPLPLKAEMLWTLDGSTVTAESLTGKSGKLLWQGIFTQDTSLEVSLREGFLAQIQLSLDLDKATLLDAKDATVTVVGHMATLVWTLLPETEDTFSFEADILNFSMVPVMISMVQYKNPLSGDTSNLTDGVKKMEDAGFKLADGSDELANGVVSLLDGIVNLNNGIQKLAGGSSDLSSGLTGVSAGMGQYGVGLNEAMSGLNNAATGLSQLQASSAQLLEGQKASLAGLKKFAAGNAQLAQLAASLAASENPAVAQLAGGVITQGEGLAQLIAGAEQQVTGFTQFNDGLAQTIQAVAGGLPELQKLPAGFTQIHNGLKQVMAGSVDLKNGMTETAKGTAAMVDETKTLPDGAKELAVGQRELADGLSTMRKETADMLPAAKDDSKATISYADGKTEIHSLQYVIRVDGIAAIENVKPDGPRDVILPWYKEVWLRLKGLFS